MSDVEVALWGVIAVVAGGLIVWFMFYAFSGQTKPPSNLTQETLKRLVGSTGRATSDVTESTGNGACEQRGILCEDIEGDYSERD